MGLLAWPLSHSLKTDSFVGRRTTTTTTTTPFGTDLWEIAAFGWLLGGEKNLGWIGLRVTLDEGPRSSDQ